MLAIATQIPRRPRRQRRHRRLGRGDAGDIDATSPKSASTMPSKAFNRTRASRRKTLHRLNGADYEVGPAQFNTARSTGEGILVIDDFGAGVFPELVRYRNRICGFYRISGDNIEAQVLSVHLPKRLGDVLVSFAGPEFIPAMRSHRSRSRSSKRTVSSISSTKAEAGWSSRTWSSWFRSNPWC
jgi:hypothetical protein